MGLIIRTFAKKKDLVVKTASIVNKGKATLRSTVLSQLGTPFYPSQVYIHVCDENQLL